MRRRRLPLLAGGRHSLERLPLRVTLNGFAYLCIRSYYFVQVSIHQLEGRGGVLGWQGAMLHYGKPQVYRVFPDRKMGVQERRGGRLG
ncbi:hypothetical protein GW17_00048642 [Ensete ventricosum]|nr:hypothetical protein GW17_00048642 [Ensete ventricosum]